MPTSISTFNKRVPPGAAGGGTLQALMERQKMAALAREKAASATPVIQSPWQGAALIGNTISASINEGRASRNEAQARQELADLMAKVGHEGSTPEQEAQIAIYDPELAAQMRAEAIEARRIAAEREAAIADREDTQAFTGGENAATRKQSADQFAVTSGLSREQFMEEKRAAGVSEAQAAAEYDETVRGNKVQEGQGQQQVDVSKAQLGETVRGNKVQEGQGQQQIDVSKAQLGETVRGNKAQEKNAGELLKIQQEQLAQSKLSDQPVAELRRALANNEITQADFDAAMAKETYIDPGKPGERMMPGMIEVDKKFAPEFLDWDQAGGANAVKAISQVDHAIQLLEKGGGSGFWQGMLDANLPSYVTKNFNPDGTIARDAIRETIQQTMRQTLGSQFTQTEGEALMNRAFDIDYGPEENLRRAKLLLKQISTQAKNKQAMVEHYRKNGTLGGYTGPAYDLAAVSNTDLSGGGGGAPAPAAGGGGGLQVIEVP